MLSSTKARGIAIVGFGEVGAIFGKDLAQQGIKVAVFDVLLHSQRHQKPMRAKAQACGVSAANNLQACLHEAELVISAVTASSALDVARGAAPLLRRGQMFLDLNSVSPSTKRKAASLLDRSGAHFVEAAVMAAVLDQRLKVPMLLGGAYAAQAADRLRSLGMNPEPVSKRIGVASAVKMCRSVMIKGLEALAVECLFAARRYGAEDKVLASLSATYPGMGWEDYLPDYLISRVAKHGRRRAAEMREVARALQNVGIEPTMAMATAARQEQFVRRIAKGEIAVDGDRPLPWRSLADAMPAPRRRSASRR
jgi:3-hydroxyisobutyrate dehydrogenase-like beta-hydroxyacid dehydrogenase